MEGDAAQAAVEANEAIAQVEANPVDLPHYCQDNDGNNDEGRQMKKGIQQFIERILKSGQSS
jgi:hypothetical protein